MGRLFDVDRVGLAAPSPLNDTGPGPEKTPINKRHDADNIPELSAKPLTDRFELSPWGLYHPQALAA